MSRWKFITLNALAGVLATLVLANVGLSMWNQRLGERVASRQNGLRQAAQAEVLLRRLALRVAQFAEQDPALLKLMVRHELKATFTQDGKKKEVP